MDNTKPYAKTFFGDSASIVVEIITKPSSTGLCKVQFGEGDNAKFLTRNKDRLTPLNDLAKAMLA